MARRERTYPADVPVHVVHRGVSQEDVFKDDVDRARFLEELRHSSARHQVDVHAYVLMSNHYHLLVTPRSPGGVSCMVRDLCRKYVPVHNVRRERSGTLWDGRHWSGIIANDRQFLACSRYIELNPVRAGMVRHPGGYRWSSHQSNALGRPDPLITQHELYRALGDGPGQRRSAYATLFHPEVLNSPALVAEARFFRATIRNRPRLDDASQTHHPGLKLNS